MSNLPEAFIFIKSTAIFFFAAGEAHKNETKDYSSEHRII